MNALVNKVYKRLRKIFVRIISYNPHFRPLGFYISIQEFIASDKGGKCLEIYPEYISNSNIPEDFLDRCTKYSPLPAIAIIPAARLVEIPNGRLYSDSVEHVSIISSDNKLLGELTYQNKPSNLIEQNILLKQRYFIPVKKYNGVVFHLLIGGSGSTNYYHWLIDSISRLHLLRQSGLYDKVDWFLVPGFNVDYQKDSLRMLGIPEDRLIVGDKETHIQADILLATTYVRYFSHLPIWCTNFLRENFLKVEKFTDLKTSPFVYISRKDASRRRIVNESELIELLEEYGFVSYELTRLPFIEKIQLFNQAKVILAVHGAGQANLSFCNEGTDVLEIIPEGYAFTDYYEIANKCRLNYNYMFSKSASGKKTTIGSDIVVNLDEIQRRLKKMMVPTNVQ